MSSRCLRYIALVGVACAPAGGGGPRLERVEPPQGLRDRETPIAIFGRALEPAPAESGPNLVAEPWQGEIAGHPLARAIAVSPERIDAVAPASLPTGLHDLVLKSGRRELVLARAFTVVAPRAPRIDGAEPARVGALGGTVVLKGVGFHWGSRVAVRSADVPTVWRNDETLEISTPPGEAGAARVDVFSPVGQAWREALLTYGP